MRKPKTAKTMRIVFEMLLEFAEKYGPDSISTVSEYFNTMLDDLRSEDFFGTEGQCDPRGDDR